VTKGDRIVIGIAIVLSLIATGIGIKAIVGQLSFTLRLSPYCQMLLAEADEDYVRDCR